MTFRFPRFAAREFYLGPRLSRPTDLSSAQKYLRHVGRRTLTISIRRCNKFATKADTISILLGLKENSEVDHGVRITDAALVARSDLEQS